MHKLKYLQIFGASKRGCVRHLRADFISPVPDWLFRFLPTRQFAEIIAIEDENEGARLGNTTLHIEYVTNVIN
jgi:hypothetical protein